jgi:hypothetical protein
LQQDRPDGEIADILESVFHSLFGSPGSWKPPIIAQIDEARLHFEGEQPLLDQPAPEDIIRCWSWGDTGPQLCSITHCLKRRSEEYLKPSGHRLEFVMRRTKANEMSLVFFWMRGRSSPLFDIKGVGLWVQKEGKWTPEQFTPTLWGF